MAEHFRFLNFNHILKIMLGMFLITFSYACFNVPYEIVNGGVTSFSLVVQNFVPIRIDLLSNFFTVVLLIICLLFLGKQYFLNSLIGSIFYMGFLSWAVNLNIVLAMPKIIATLLSAVIVGVGYYLCIISESSTIGFDVIAMIVNKRNPKVSIGKLLRLISVAVVLAGGAVYGMEAILYGILFSCLQTCILDRLIKRKKGIGS